MMRMMPKEGDDEEKKDDFKEDGDDDDVTNWVKGTFISCNLIEAERI